MKERDISVQQCIGRKMAFCPISCWAQIPVPEFPSRITEPTLSCSRPASSRSRSAKGYVARSRQGNLLLDSALSIMPVEKPAPAPTPDISEIDAVRRAAIRKRVLAEEWAGPALRDLTKAVARMHTQAPNTITRTEYAVLAEGILCLCDQIGVAADVAAASIHVAGNERFELATEMADIEAEVRHEELEVERLRKVLDRERRQAERRKQYEALANIILKEPEPAESQKRLDEANQELAEVEKEIAQIEEMKDAMSKELSLFLNCASHLDSFSTKFATLLVEEEGEVAMDTTA